ncbi:MAG TPA: cytochrome c, partial [Pseudomonas sp.]|nr:cytochrome c [Pseudomonas sp.]
MGLKPLAALTLLGMASAAVATDNIDFSASQKLYEEHCTVCHGAQRIGAAGPALLPESLGRIKKPEASKAISEGRPASQMAAYKDILSPAQIDSMVEYLYTPIENPPTWDDADTRASHRMLVDVSTLSETPLHQADPLNLFVVV